MNFKRRWLIVGTLTTLTPLHIGSGEIADRKGPVNETTKEPVKISGIASNKDSKPYLPGSTLKGNLRAWASESGLAVHVESLFGSADARDPNAIGGKAEFLDAQAVIARALLNLVSHEATEALRAQVQPHAQTQHNQQY